MTEEDKKRMGWICPKCKAVNSPDEKVCKCSKNIKEDSSAPGPELLLE